MLNPIKRIWTPKAAPQAQPTAVPEAVASEPAFQAPAAAATKPPITRNVLFDELPSPDMEEKNSDSVWAVFDSVLFPEEEQK